MADNSRSVPSLEEKIIQQKVIRADPRKAQAVMQDLITIFKEDKDPAERKILKDTQRALEAFTRNSIANQKLFAAYMDAIQSRKDIEIGFQDGDLGNAQATEDKLRAFIVLAGKDNAKGVLLAAEVETNKHVQEEVEERAAGAA